jgi:hypothetical protein
MIKINGRTITDDYIIRVETWAGAKKVVAKLENLGYSFAADVQKHRCYYIGRSVVFDDGSEPTMKLINWGRDEVEESEDFSTMQTYEEFMEEPEPEDVSREVDITVEELELKIRNPTIETDEDGNVVITIGKHYYVIGGGQVMYANLTSSDDVKFMNIPEHNPL